MTTNHLRIDATQFIKFIFPHFTSLLTSSCFLAKYHTSLNKLMPCANVLIPLTGAFYLYASLALCGLLFLYLVLPETRGKSLEEIEDLFKEPLLIPCKKDYLEVTRGING